MTPGIIEKETRAAVAVKGPTGVGAYGSRRAGVGCGTLIDVLAQSSISTEPCQTGTLVAPQPVYASSIGVARAFFSTFIDVGTYQPISHKTTPAGAAVRPLAVHTFCIRATNVAGTFVDVHTALPVSFVAAAARALVAARQIFAAFVAK